ncbi:MAG: hypothetical protein ABI533_02500, partial [Betaproteobacteria bacterium]
MRYEDDRGLCRSRHPGDVDAPRHQSQLRVRLRIRRRCAVGGCPCRRVTTAIRAIGAIAADKHIGRHPHGQPRLACPAAPFDGRIARGNRRGRQTRIDAASRHVDARARGRLHVGKAAAIDPSEETIDTGATEIFVTAPTRKTFVARGSIAVGERAHDADIAVRGVRTQTIEPVARHFRVGPHHGDVALGVPGYANPDGRGGAIRRCGVDDRYAGITREFREVSAAAA